VVAGAELKDKLAKIQGDLMLLMAKVADPRKREYSFTQEQVTFLEAEIDRLEAAFPRKKAFVLYGGCELSARLDVARTVARRAERRFFKAAQWYGADAKAQQYINRLSDYLYIEARYADYLAGIDR
jgi:cob(I)alamin adenosyltransferase